MSITGLHASPTGSRPCWGTRSSCDPRSRPTRPTYTLSPRRQGGQTMRARELIQGGTHLPGVMSGEQGTSDALGYDVLHKVHNQPSKEGKISVPVNYYSNQMSTVCMTPTASRMCVVPLPASKNIPGGERPTAIKRGSTTMHNTVKSFSASTPRVSVRTPPT